MTSKIKSSPEITADLASKDHAMAWLMQQCDPVEVTLHEDYFASLASAIVGQQLSNKVADVLWERLKRLVEGQVSPETILCLDDEKIREIGISYAKIKYLKSLAYAIASGSLSFDDFHLLKDHEVRASLCSVKGIGPWTAEMFLIFSLGRLDIFSMGDAGLQRAVKWLYGLEESPSKKELLEISNNWAPYRTIASLYLWKALDGELMSKTKAGE